MMCSDMLGFGSSYRRVPLIWSGWDDLRGQPELRMSHQQLVERNLHG